MKKIMMKSFAVLMMIGAFALVSFAQKDTATVLTLKNGSASDGGTLFVKQGKDYKIALKTETYVCISARSDISSMKVTFDGNSVSAQPNNCFEITADRDYSIKITHESRDNGNFDLQITATDILKLENADRGVFRDLSIAGKSSKSFRVKLESGKTVCLGAVAKSPDSPTDKLAWYLDVFFNDKPLSISAPANCQTKITETRFYEIFVKNRGTAAGIYELGIRYQ